MGTPLDDLPGYRRRFLIVPAETHVTAALEDDYHCMAVTLHHADGVVAAVEPVMDRAPWTTCPGAPQKLIETFTGVALADVAGRGEKLTNCTHLHDLAVLGAAHAGDGTSTRYDIVVSDVHDGRNAAEIRRDGTVLQHWELERGFTMLEPFGAAGLNLLKLRGWIGELEPVEREPARLLQWGAIVAHGRMRPLEDQSDAMQMPPNCYTFQPDRAPMAKRVGRIIDFSGPGREPLSHFDGVGFATTRSA